MENYDNIKLHYRVVDVDEKEHSFTGRYWTDVLTEEFLAARNQYGHITFTEGGYPEICMTDFHYNFYDKEQPTKEDMEEIIRQSVNLPWLYMKEQLFLDNTDYTLSEIKQYVGSTGTMSVSNGEIQIDGHLQNTL